MKPPFPFSHLNRSGLKEVLKGTWCSLPACCVVWRGAVLGRGAVCLWCLSCSEPPRSTVLNEALSSRCGLELGHLTWTACIWTSSAEWDQLLASRFLSCRGTHEWQKQFMCSQIILLMCLTEVCRLFAEELTNWPFSVNIVTAHSPPSYVST